MKSVLAILLMTNFHLSFGQCICLNGIVYDQKEHKPIVANFLIKADNKKLSLGKSNENGYFKLELPCNLDKLILQRKDFRNLEIPIVNTAIQGNFYVDFYLTPLDKETFDRPYSQSEQSDFILDKKKQTNKFATRIFKVLDASTNKEIKSKVCLIYTNSGRKKCFETLTDGEKISFEEEDIIAVEVESSGYQNYVGNLILNNLNNQTSIYEITLTKIPKIIIANIEGITPKSIQRVSINNSDQKKFEVVRNDTQFYSYLHEIGNYNCEIYNSDNKKKEFETSIKLGLNFFSFKFPTADTNEAALSTAPIGSPDLKAFDKEIIYFEQSDFILTKFARESLNKIAKLFIQNPNISAVIEGHTDNVGDPIKNETLAEYRAKTTYSYLINCGVDPKKISWIAYGGDKPISPNDNEDNKKKNRRVEIIFK